LNLRYTFRLARVLLHFVQGLATCLLVFPWASERARMWHVQRWSRALLGICGVRVEELPGEPAARQAMVVANHVSWLDIFVINALYPSRFVAKAEIRAWPVVGWLVALAGTVFIARGNRRDLRHIFQGLVEALKGGRRVAFFPEGTTALQGNLLPFHANLFEAAIDAHIPVQPFALRYVCACGGFHPAVEYVGDRTFVQSMRIILRADGVRAQLRCLPAMRTEGAHRRELAAAAQQAVADALR
jgi:1-acyl-sn-glycerol-3-phosphate acyltransferase